MPSLGRIFCVVAKHRAAAVAVLLAGTCLALAPEARAAAAAPTPLPVGEGKPDTPFKLTGPTDVAVLKLKATAGADLSIGVGTFQPLLLQVLDPSGRLVRSFTANGFADFPIQEGVELHPASSGTYTVRISADPESSLNYPVDAAAWAYPDCRGGPATRCAIAPGKTASASFAGANDDDAYAIKAPAGRSYTATLKVQSPGDVLYFTDLNLVNGDGDVVQTQLTGAGPARRNMATLRFKLPASGGPFHLQAQPRPPAANNVRAKFTLSLTRQ